MNDKNEEKAVVSQGKSNKKRRFRPKNKNKQEDLDQNTQNGEQKASQSVIDNFFLEPFDGGEQHAQNGEQTNANKQNGKKNRGKVKIKTLTNKPLTPKIKQAKLNKKSKKNRRKIYPLS